MNFIIENRPANVPTTSNIAHIHLGAFAYFTSRNDASAPTPMGNPKEYIDCRRILSI
jgi:hypothetical protein